MHSYFLNVFLYKKNKRIICEWHIWKSGPLKYMRELDSTQRDKAYWSGVFLLKMLFATSAIGSSTWGRFAPIYYLSRGLNPQEIGIIGCITPLIQGIARPCWCAYADQIKNRKAIFLFTRTISSILLLALAFSAVDNFFSILILTVAMSLFVSTGILVRNLSAV